MVDGDERTLCGLRIGCRALFGQYDGLRLQYRSLTVAIEEDKVARVARDVTVRPLYVSIEG